MGNVICRVLVLEFLGRVKRCGVERFMSIFVSMGFLEIRVWSKILCVVIFLEYLILGK